MIEKLKIYKEHRYQHYKNNFLEMIYSNLEQHHTIINQMKIEYGFDPTPKLIEACKQFFIKHCESDQIKDHKILNIVNEDLEV